MIKYQVSDFLEEENIQVNVTVHSTIPPKNQLLEAAVTCSLCSWPGCTKPLQLPVECTDQSKTQGRFRTSKFINLCHTY